MKIDINDTLIGDGLEAVRARHDHAGSLNILPPPTAPMEVARQYVGQHQQHKHLLTLRRWHGGWWHWRRSYWAEVDAGLVRHWLYAFTADACYLTRKGKLVEWLPNRYRISDVADALAAECFLEADVEQPCWLSGHTTGTIVACANGLLDVERRELLPLTPDFFNVTAVPFSYDASAQEATRWLDFLAALWPSEPDAIHLLSEWFGYILSGRTDLHKIMLMVGPTRGGKGVIARVLSSMIGKRHVCGPTLHSLGGEFGLAPLIGKPLAIVSDARFAGNNAVVVERLLSISGEDALTVNRKYQDQWTGRLPSRLHIISNELPRFGDASAAIIGRVLHLTLSRSWLGKEDYGLEKALNVELPAILNWALDGLRRLTVDNESVFTRIAGSEEVIADLRDLASPVGAFVRDNCEINPQQQIAVDALYIEYGVWCDANGHRRANKLVFGRDLHAAVPTIKVMRPRDSGTKRSRAYGGIGLRR